MSVFLQMSLVGVGDILWVLRSTLRTHIPCEGGWLRCRSSSLLVNEWFRQGVAGSQSFRHRRYIHWKYGRSMRGTRWVLAQDVCGCGLVGWEPLSLTQVDSALPYFLSKDVCSLGRWIAFPTCPPKLLLHQGQRWEWHSLTQSTCQQYVNLCHQQRWNNWLWVDWGRSFMKMRNNTGPRTVLWGIPDFGICHLDDAPFSWAHCSLRWRKLANHSRAL